MATPWGVVPTEMGLPMNWPNVGLGWGCPATVIVGLMSMTEMLLQPVLETTAMGEKGPLASWSAIATEEGCVLVGLPLVLVQIVDKSTAWTTKKSAALDCALGPVPPEVRTSRAYLCGAVRKDCGIVTVSCRGLSTVTFAAGIGVLSRRTCVVPLPPLKKPEPKICTPQRSVAEVSVP